MSPVGNLQLSVGKLFANATFLTHDTAAPNFYFNDYLIRACLRVKISR